MNKKRKKRKRLKIKSVLIFIFVLILLFLLGYGSTLIKVRGYYIKNNVYLSDEEVLNELKLDNNSSFLLTNTLFEKGLVKKSKLIESIKIKRTLDLEMIIEVKEYKVLFYDEKNKKTVLGSGAKVDYSDPDVPVLINNIDTEDVYNTFVKKMNKVNNETLNMISEITYSPNGIDKERFLLSMNDGNYVYVTLTKLSKINDYKSIINSVENKKGILYLDYGNYFVPKE